MNLEPSPVEEFRMRLVKELVDYIALKYLLERGKLSGYDLSRLINAEYDILLSPGTIYGRLYALERKGLANAHWEERKRELTLTDKGKKVINTILSDPIGKKILQLLRKTKTEVTIEETEKVKANVS